MRTRSGKLIRRPTSQLYKERAPARKWNNAPDATQYPRHLVCRLPDWTREDHEEAAAAHLRVADRHERLHIKYVTEGYEKYGSDGAMISGGFREHWPEELKDKIRKHSHAVRDYRAAWWAHSQVAKMRSVLRREELEIARTFGD